MPLLFGAAMLAACSGIRAPSAPDPKLARERSIAPDAPKPPTAPVQISELDALIDSLARVGSETHRSGDTRRLKPAPAEMKSRIERGEVLTADQWKRVLSKTGALRIRDRWPRSTPFAVSMRDPAWLEVTQIRMVPRAPMLKPIEVGRTFSETCGVAATWDYQAWMYQEVGDLELGDHRLEFDVTIERGENGMAAWRRFFGEQDEPTPAVGVIWQGTMSFDTTIVPSLDEAIPPVSTPSLDRAVRDSISLAFDT